VFKNGLKVNKIGPYDGHLTNSDANARNDLEDAIYLCAGVGLVTDSRAQTTRSKILESARQI